MPNPHDSKSTALVAIDFHNDKLVTFSHEGTPYVAMRRVVENIGLAWQPQHRKLTDEGERFSCHHMVTHDTAGRQQEMLAMPVSKLPLWLATVNPNKITDPAKKAKVELYQAESAIALHDYWTKGVAVKGDHENVVAEFDPKLMAALGGMFKQIVRKALTDLREPLADGALLAHHASVSHGYTAGEVVAEVIEDRKGLRGLPRRVSDALRRYCSEVGVAVKIGRLGSSSAYVFDGSVVRVWLRDKGGKQFIERLAAEKRGQGKLQFVVTGPVEA